MPILADHLPQYSHEFDNTNSFTKTNGAFGQPGTVSSVTMRFKRDGTGVEEYLYSKGGDEGDPPGKGQNVYIQSGGKIRVNDWNSVPFGMLFSINNNYFETTTTFDDTDWHEILVQFSCNNATQAERIKVWIDGSAETASASNLLQGGRRKTSARAYIGADRLTNFIFDGLIYNFAYSANGTIHATTDIAETDGTAADLKSLSNRVHPDSDAGSLRSDWVQANWLNSGTALSSTLGDDAV